MKSRRLDREAVSQVYSMKRYKRKEGIEMSAASTANFTGTNLMKLKDALLLSTSRTAHLFAGGQPLVRVQSFPYCDNQWYVAHTVVIEEGIPCGLEDDAIGTERDLLNWLVAHGYCASVNEARAMIEC